MRYLIAGLFVITLSTLTGCASNEFKADYWGDLYPPTDFAEVVSTPPADAEKIGRSWFVSSRRPGDSQAISAAKSVGADLVTWESSYVDSSSHSGVMQYTTPTTETTYHSGNVYGSSGSASYSGSSTTYGSETTYVPYTYTLYWYSYKSSFYRSADLMKAKAPLTPVQPIGKTREKKRNGIVTGKEWHYFDK